MAKVHGNGEDDRNTRPCLCTVTVMQSHLEDSEMKKDVI